MNRNQIILIFTPFLLIFCYQNCQKSKFDSVNYSTSNPSQSISLASESVQRIEFKSNKVVQVQNGVSSISVIKNFLYDFNLESGEVFVKDIQAQMSLRYCLTEALKIQINSLLSSASVCKYNVSQSTGQVCAQVIQEGYANLMTNRDIFNLGSATDSCGSNKVDFCDDSTQIKMWFENIKPIVPNLTCQ